MIWVFRSLNNVNRLFGILKTQMIKLILHSIMKLFAPTVDNFTIGQLSKAYETIFDIINITFVPYGNAHETLNSSSQLYEYVCQHGSDECLGNLIHVNRSQTSFFKINLLYFSPVYWHSIQQFNNIL